MKGRCGDDPREEALYATCGRAMSKKDKGRIGGQFVPLLHSTIDSCAWRQMSHTAQMLYVALKRRVPRERNQAYLSYRQAREELRAGPQKIAESFKELQHYGFIVLAQHGCLGVEGKGKSPHWRLTELGTTSKMSSDGLPEAPTRDFLRWDGVVFERRRRKRTPGSYGCKKQNPSMDVENTPIWTGVTPAIRTWRTPQSQSDMDGVHIESAESGTDVDYISSLTTPPDPTPPSLELSKTPSAPSLQDDPRIHALGHWGGAAKRNPWTKPTILSDEPRDFSEFPLDVGELAA